MTEYLALNRGTTQWLLENKSTRDAIAELVSSDFAAFSAAAPFAIGPLRASRSADDSVVALWNIDYSTVSGDDALAFIRCAEPLSFLGVDQEVALATFERILMVINQRFLNRLFPQPFFYRRLDSGGEKVAAPKRVNGELQNIGFTESIVAIGHNRVRAMLLVGPAFDWDKVAKFAVENRESLEQLAGNAQQATLAKRAFPRPNANIAEKLAALADKTGRGMPVALPFTQRTRADGISPEDVYRSLSWDFGEWLSSDSTLADEQRYILDSELVESNPLRIVGPAGSGKTLLMQLLALKLLRTGTAGHVLYVTHNNAMRSAAHDRFLVLGAREEMMAKLAVRTLADYMGELTGIAHHNTLDQDPEKAKLTQDEILQFALDATIAKSSFDPKTMRTIPTLLASTESRRVLLELIKSDISTAIKARDIGHDRDAYVNSEFSLGQLHGALSPEERDFVYSVFESYQNELNKYEVLDNDDIALTMLATLRSPKWQNLQRRTLGFDYVLVDEAQLFNDNECQVFHLLTKGTKSFVPVVLALDAAQDLYSTSKSGLASLGIKGLQRGVLSSTHRMPAAIARLAYFVLSKTAGLFSEDFPDFTFGFDENSGDIGVAKHLELAPDKLARSINRLVRDCRSRGLRQFAIVCHDQSRQSALRDELDGQMRDLDFMIVEQRGQRPASDHAFVIFCRPELVGGQEFDAVISVGLEEGIVPIRVPENPILEQALEQEAYREMYLTFSRTRHELYIVTTSPGRLSPVLAEAKQNGFLRETG